MKVLKKVLKKYSSNFHTLRVTFRLLSSTLQNFINQLCRMEVRINSIINSRQYKTKQGFPLEYFLYGFSKIYKLIILFRHYLYKSGILQSKKVSCFVISIGNIVAGGTGKTPMTIFLAKYLTSLEYKVAIVTRGYKGEFEHKNGIVCDGKNILCTPSEAGDESYMMAQVLKLPLLVGKNRYKSCITAIEKFSCDIIILDDAFQHISLKRDLDLLLIDAKNPFGNRYLLPRGILREPLISLQRCDCVIYTHSNQDNQDNLQGTSDIISKAIPVFKSSHIPYIKLKISENFITPSFKSQKDKIQNLKSPSYKSPSYKSKNALIFSGIANNSNFKHSCENMGLIVKKHLQFGDHYQYKKGDIDKIKTLFKQESADLIVTSLKDYVKISHCFSNEYPVMVLDVKINFNKQNRHKFEIFIKNRLKHQNLNPFN